MWGVFAVLASAILIFCKALGLAVKFALEFVDLIFGTDFEVESAKFNMYRGYVEIRTADGVDLNFVKGRGLGLSNVKAMLGYMEADLPRASVLAQVVPQSALDANDIEGSSIPSDFQPRLGHVESAKFNMCRGYVEVRKLLILNMEGKGYQTPCLLWTYEALVQSNSWRLIGWVDK
eukprot:6120671-Amphidinium_carterae.1